MLLKSLLFALLLSGAAADADDEAPTLIPPPLPRLRGTAQMNSSDVSEGASPDDVIERAAVSNQFNPGPRRNFVVSRRVSSDEPEPGSRFQRRASGEWLHHRSSSESSTTRPTVGPTVPTPPIGPIPYANPCPKPYTQSGPFCCFGPPMAPECYKWTD